MAYVSLHATCPVQYSTFNICNQWKKLDENIPDVLSRADDVFKDDHMRMKMSLARNGKEIMDKNLVEKNLEK